MSEGLFSRGLCQRLILFEFVGKSTEVSALRALSTAVVFAAGELVLFAEVTFSVKGVLSA